MDLDKLSIFIKTLGFPVTIAVWYLWKIQAYLDASQSNQAQMVELMRQLIALHTK